MQKISNVNNEGLPSSKSLIKATAFALVAAIILLFTAILPAEYGIDPTGIGERIGLTVLNTASAIEEDEVAVTPDTGSLSTGLNPVWKSDMQYRADSLTVTLLPNQGSELKSKMKVGENFSFNWEVQGGVVNFDMHGEKINDGDRFTSYWLGRNASSSKGSFSAPFDGTHGWYWKNKGTDPVTIHLTVSGFYDAFYMP
jgi:hypothetical protein